MTLDESSKPLPLGNSSSTTSDQSSKPLPMGNNQVSLPKDVLFKGIPNKKVIRELGLKVTNQRISILEVIRSSNFSHFTAQEAFETVSEKSPEIGFATVYRFLKKLSEHQFVTEVRMGGMPARYEWASKRHHDHLTCSRCGQIVEFENQKIENLQKQIARHYGFKLTHHILELYGLCRNCQ